MLGGAPNFVLHRRTAFALREKLHVNFEADDDLVRH